MESVLWAIGNIGLLIEEFEFLYIYIYIYIYKYKNMNTKFIQSYKVNAIGN